MQSCQGPCRLLTCPRVCFVLWPTGGLALPSLAALSSVLTLSPGPVVSRSASLPHTPRTWCICQAFLPVRTGCSRPGGEGWIRYTCPMSPVSVLLPRSGCEFDGDRSETDLVSDRRSSVLGMCVCLCLTYASLWLGSLFADNDMSDGLLRCPVLPSLPCPAVRSTC